ncbi:MAG: hypothetical protein AAFP69_22820, partial [Planctomycetota bacterium]
MATSSQATPSAQVSDNRIDPPRVRPSIVDPPRDDGLSLDQELTTFARWTSEPIWVPPKDNDVPMADSILRQHHPWSDRDNMWRAAVRDHREKFTQVREIEMHKASIRLPDGRLYVSVLNADQFDQIEEVVPDCVQTRLDEFMNGPAQRLNARVYYIKPLCVEVGNDLIFSTREEIDSAIEDVKAEVFRTVRRAYFRRMPRRVAAGIANVVTAVPRYLVRQYLDRRQRRLDAYQAKLEFQRRVTARDAMRLHQKCRTDGCTFNEMLDLTNPLVTEDVINQYATEQELSNRQRQEMLRMAAGALPWFFAASLATFQTVSLAIAVHAAWTAPVLVCDPAFVAEIPGENGRLLKIGHFD